MRTKSKKVHYFPGVDAGGSKIFFEGDGGGITHGFGGAMAEQGLFDALESDAEIIIEKPKEQTTMIKAKIRRFHAILAKKGLMDLKEDLLDEYGAKSTTELTERQLDELIGRLDNTDVPPSIRKARSSVLTQLAKLGITGSNEDGWDDVNGYLIDKRIAGKILYDMDLSELRACQKKLLAIRGKEENENSPSK